MDNLDLMWKVSEIQCQLMDTVTKLSAVERELMNERSKVIELSCVDVDQLNGGFTITVIHEGRALRLRMKSMVEAL